MNFVFKDICKFLIMAAIEVLFLDMYEFSVIVVVKNFFLHEFKCIFLKNFKTFPEKFLIPSTKMF